MPGWVGRGATSTTLRAVPDGRLRIIMHLGLPEEHRIEYVRFIMVVCLLLSQWHESLPLGIPRRAM